MIYKPDTKQKLWVYNPETGSITRRTLVCRANDIEGVWFEAPKGWPTFDSFYIDENKEELENRIYKKLSKELKETLSRADILIAFLKSLGRI